MRRTLAAAVAISLVLAGCGDLGAGDETDRATQLQLVRKSDLARYPEGSPARTVLEWWRALQFASATQAVRLYAADVEVNQAKLQRQLEKGVDLLRLRARPAVVDVVEDGGEATVYVVFTRAELNPNGRADEAKETRSVDLVREDGQWKIADNVYIDRTFRQATRFVREGLKQEKQKRSDPGE